MHALGVRETSKEEHWGYSQFQRLKIRVLRGAGALLAELTGVCFGETMWHEGGDRRVSHGPVLRCSRSF